MAFTEGENDGTLNGLNEVIVVPAPAASTRRIVKTIFINNVNLDSVIGLRVSLARGATRRIIWAGNLAGGDTWVFGDEDVAVLGSPSGSYIIAQGSGALGPSNPDFFASWGDST